MLPEYLLEWQERQAYEESERNSEKETHVEGVNNNESTDFL